MISTRRVFDIQSISSVIAVPTTLPLLRWYIDTTRAELSITAHHHNGGAESFSLIDTHRHRELMFSFADEGKLKAEASTVRQFATSIEVFSEALLQTVHYYLLYCRSIFPSLKAVARSSYRMVCSSALRLCMLEESVQYVRL